MSNNSNASFRLGAQYENEFAEIRKSYFIRFATDYENINEHWDILDSELGRIDIKSPKKTERNGLLDYAIWWEIKTVFRPPENKSENGWGIGNGIRRYIAIRLENGFYILSPEEVSSDLKIMNDRQPFLFGNDFYQIYQRENRGDKIIKLPTEYVLKNYRHFIRVH